MATRFLILFLLIVQAAKAVSPDIPKHYQFRNVVFQNLADEILNSAAKQNITLYKNQILITLQNDLNPVFDEVVLQSENFSPCNSIDDDCIYKQYEKLQAANPQKIENSFLIFTTIKNIFGQKFILRQNTVGMS